MLRLTLITGLLASCLLFACQKNSEAIRQEKEEYRLKVESIIEELDDKMMVLREQLETSGAEFSNEIEGQLSMLEQEKQGLEEKLRAFDQAAGEEWEDLQEDIDRQLAYVQELITRETRAGFGNH